MKTWQIIAVVVAVVAASATFFTASAFAMMNERFRGTGINAYNSGNMMTGGYSGMMGGYAYNQQGTSCGNHGQIANPSISGGSQITLTQAQANAQNYVAGLNNPDLEVKQLEEYSNNFYAQITEKSSGNGAFELIVDKYTGNVYPEMGPNMMWNAKYPSQPNGMMDGGMMGSLSNITPTTSLPVSLTQAKANAQQYLDANNKGKTAGDATTFYGYYTFAVLNNGAVYGMISVNGYTGQSWYHNWHGTFIQESSPS